jgi:hypothetical protein
VQTTSSYKAGVKSRGVPVRLGLRLADAALLQGYDCKHGGFNKGEALVW